MSLKSYLEKIQYNEEDLTNHYGIAAIIYNDQKKILMLDHIKFNFWTIPVGKVTQDQTIEEGLIQELEEEVNITPIDFKQIDKLLKTYPRRGKRVKVDARLFEVIKYKGKVKNNEPKKHRSMKYMSIEEIKQLPKISHMTKLALKYLSH
jgi:ADP-ribose pyrophosphatase YjhB (NUDIX family)